MIFYFGMKLPPLRSATDETKRPVRDHGSGPRRAPGTGTRARPRLLVVEDHEDTREMIAWAMRAAGWMVEAVSTAEDAFFDSVAFEPDAIVMDLHLPTLSGVEAIRRLRAADGTSDVPIVACTAFVSDAVRAEAREAGCTEFLAKPFAPEQLYALLESLVRRAG
jgi:two-component system phosphate regulon response regulator PhoB